MQTIDIRTSWVFSSELPSSQSSGHIVYDPSQSSTAQQLSGATWNITYGDGSSSSGDVYTDTVTVGGTTVTGQAVELAQQVSAQFQQDSQNDGLLGLAFSSINTGMCTFGLCMNVVLKVGDSYATMADHLLRHCRQ